ncbi:CBS domain-containing protein [Haloechinothrix sp. YIM 98757]|uniref:CBS domain-containing protein n=1 Tax=Haloechinothrix aidingensis TaxID=2752311 RepID=A0A838A7A5_9PSEU|nr:CBS domain-containing protein [Haloechinothrix aidingensis]MBA0125860.1 CBS domain-containing protein [Haloechinothrix aidingensis]
MAPDAVSRLATAQRGKPMRRQPAPLDTTGCQSTCPALSAELTRCTVREIMLTAPKTLPTDTSSARAATVFEDPHVHMLLLTTNGILRGTLTREDLTTSSPPTASALRLSTLTCRTTAPEQPILTIHRWMVTSGQRRLAVVDPDNRLLGLLCLKRDRTGFCTDSGVAARARERAAYVEP